MHYQLQIPNYFSSQDLLFAINLAALRLVPINQIAPAVFSLLVVLHLPGVAHVVR